MDFQSNWRIKMAEMEIIIEKEKEKKERKEGTKVDIAFELLSCEI